MEAKRDVRVDELVEVLAGLTVEQWEIVGILYRQVDGSATPDVLEPCCTAEYVLGVVETAADFPEQVRMLSRRALSPSNRLDLRTPTRQDALRYARTLIQIMGNSSASEILLKDYASLLRLAVQIPSSWAAELSALVSEVGLERALETIELVER